MAGQVQIVGIAGLPRSGKDTVADVFKEKGYFGVSLGDIVRDISRDRHKDSADPISVANMTETSNWLRSVYGPDFALKKALKLYNEALGTQHYKGLVVWSVRAPVEVIFILEHGGQLIWVEASDEVRHNRAIHNLRQGEANLTLEAFKAQEALQWQPQPGLPSDVQMNIAYVKAKATKQIINNSDDLEAFNKQINELIINLNSDTP
jgi:dephospho-CoA kinase